MRERLGVVAIVVFVLVDVVLVTLAFRHVEPDTSASAPIPPDPSSPAAGPSSSSPSSTASVPEAGDGALYLSVAEDGTLLRAERGSCAGDTPPVVEVSTDDARTFERVEIDPDLSEVVRVQAEAAGNLWVVGADAACNLGVYRGGAERQEWELSPGTLGAWHLLLGAERAAVHSPTGVVPTSCTPVSLAPVDQTRARALCRNGDVIGTDDGQSWNARGHLDGAVSIAFTSAQEGYALARSDGCAATLRTVDGGATWEELTCLGKQPPRSVTAKAGVILAQVASTIHRSADAGGTWQRP